MCGNREYTFPRRMGRDTTDSKQNGHNGPFARVNTTKSWLPHAKDGRKKRGGNSKHEEEETAGEGKSEIGGSRTDKEERRHRRDLYEPFGQT